MNFEFFLQVFIVVGTAKEENPFFVQPFPIYIYKNILIRTTDRWLHVLIKLFYSGRIVLTGVGPTSGFC